MEEIETLTSLRLLNTQHILQRDRRNNEDKKIQPPFENNLFDETEEQEIEIEETNNEMNHVQGNSSYSYLTQNDYEDSIVLNHIYETANEHESVSMRQYDLRPRQTGIKQNVQT